MHPRFEAVYHDDFEKDRRRLGLSGTNFDFFFADVEDNLTDYPWEFSTEVPDSGGTMMHETRSSYPDIPPLYVYYKVNVEANRILFLGLSHAWSRSETV